MFAKSRRKAIPLLMGILAVAVTSPTPAMANRHGIWWHRHNEEFSITLINLTDHKLIATSNTVTVGPSSQSDCYPYPFEHFGVHVDPYKSAIWKTDVSLPWPSSVQYYNGKITFQIEGMDPEWAFDLNFLPEDADGPGKGTWIYLTATDVDNIGWNNIGWIASWLYEIYDWANLGPGYRGYATPLNDAGNLHNQMNLEGTELAVTVYTSDNINITLVVQQTHELDYPPQQYRAWKLDWVDNDADGVPSE
jgi:hypothetical protein